MRPYRSLRRFIRGLGRTPTRFPAMPHLGLEAAPITLGFARGTQVHRELIGDAWRYEPDTMSVLLALLSRGSPALFVDVGANVGYFPIIVKKLFGDRVDCLAYEPTPRLARTIERGCRANAVEVEIARRAVSNEIGEASFYLSAKADTSSSLNEHFRDHEGVIRVPLTTLDADLVHGPPRRGLDRCVLLVDTETTEPDVLQGARELIERHRPAIVCEVLADRTEAPISRIVDEIGYDAWALTDEGIEPRREIRGDPHYRHRDWLFMPAGEAPPVEAIRACLRILQPVEGPA